MSVVITVRKGFYYGRKETALTVEILAILEDYIARGFTVTISPR